MEMEEHPWSDTQKRLLDVLSHPGYRKLPIINICRLAGYGSNRAWYCAMADDHFRVAAHRYGYPLKQPGVQHANVEKVYDLEAYFQKNVWDVRAIMEYPPHLIPSLFIIDFTIIRQPVLRVQIKQYCVCNIGLWEAVTHKKFLASINLVTSFLRDDADVGTLTRGDIETAISKMQMKNFTTSQMYDSLRKFRKMLQFMAKSPAWSGSRPPKDLIWPEDVPSPPKASPRPIPREVVDQLDKLINDAVKTMDAGRTPQYLPPAVWDAVVIMRATGARFDDTVQLRADCVTEIEGKEKLRIRASDTKTKRNHLIPTTASDGIVAAVRRRQKDLGSNTSSKAAYLFKIKDGGMLTYNNFYRLMRTKLAPHLIYNDKPYTITAHQFRFTIAREMDESGVDIVTISKFLGHKNVEITMSYIQSLRDKPPKEYTTYPNSDVPKGPPVVGPHIENPAIEEKRQKARMIASRVSKFGRWDPAGPSPYPK